MNSSTCPACQGSGLQSVIQRTYGFNRPCPACEGIGYIKDKPGPSATDEVPAIPKWKEGGGCMKVCIVMEGAYYTERRCVEEVHATKGLAVASTRNAGFRYCKGQSLWLNDETCMHRTLFMMPVLGINKRGKK